MYKNFFGLTQEPFDISPDPRFYYPTERHNEALASLSYGIGRRKGFIVLTGEVGTGKTLLVRYLLETLTRSNVQCAYVCSPRLSPDDFLRYLLAEFKVTASANRGEMLQQLTNALMEAQQRGSTTTLLIDEAHLLTQELLEEILLLTNLETSRYKLLQIVLVGQPELDDRLESPELRQLKQRVALRCRLLPLGEADVSGYLSRRLQIAGAPKELMAEVFPPATIASILRYSGGIPRMINTICDNAMLSAYARRQRTITVEQIEEVAQDLRLSPIETRSDATKPPQVSSAFGSANLGHPQPQARVEQQAAPETLAAAAAASAGAGVSLGSEESMSRVFDALRQYESEEQGATAPVTPVAPAAVVPNALPQEPDLENVECIAVDAASTKLLVAMTDEDGLGAEKFRALATRLTNTAKSMSLKTVQVTSSIIGEGKTLVACNLALSLAKRSAKKVLLIEGDLRKPAVCKTFGLPPLPGIGEWWCGQERRRRPRPGSQPRTWQPRSVVPFLRHVENSNLWLLAAGAVTHPMPILQSTRIAALMAQLAQWFDWVVVDTPPLLPMADSNLWSRLVDGTLMVVRQGTVPRKALQRAIESMDNPKLVGVAINDARNFDRVDYYGHYYYAGGGAKSESREESQR